LAKLQVRPDDSPQRQLEAFIVHMSLGWLKLLQAHVEEARGDLYKRDKRGWRKKHAEGGYVFKPLRTLLDELFKPNDPRVANIAFFQRLRNQIEHRHDDGSTVSRLVRLP
jgi:hypothetical protein